jgi:hypothetical protein
MTHTQGPWHRNIPPASKYPVIFAGRNTHVAILAVRGTSMPPEEIEANCNLIAAAPELLYALKEVAIKVGRCPALEIRGMIDPIIRKAEGK